MTQPTAAIAKLVDKGNLPQIGDQQAAIVSFTDNSGGTGADTLAVISAGYVQSEVANSVASLADKIEEIQVVLRAHGLIAD